MSKLNINEHLFDNEHFKGLLGLTLSCCIMSMGADIIRINNDFKSEPVIKPSKNTFTQDNVIFSNIDNELLNYFYENKNNLSNVGYELNWKTDEILYYYFTDTSTNKVYIVNNETAQYLNLDELINNKVK